MERKFAQQKENNADIEIFTIELRRKAEGFQQ